jgi:uncharacterized protein YggU (UPF0235/DUF167 family)
MKVDLHGKHHHEVSRIIDRFIWDGMRLNKKEIEVVTGNSNRMKEVVIDIIEEHQLDYSIGNVINKGFITIYL